MAADPGAVSAGQVVAVSSEAELVDAIRDAREHRAPVRIRGGGSWLQAGRPVTADRVLDVSGIRGIVEYVPGDLTLTARAGTTLAEIDEATREHGQWLPLDPFGAPEGTLGATLATASAGPLAASVGMPRDVALGATFVDGRAQLVRGGGRVVKNVAGFDLVRMTVGAWGTLGVLTEVTVRLRGRPDADESVAVELPDGDDARAHLLRAVRQASVAPLAAELLTASLAGRVGAGADTLLLVRLAGNAESVRTQRAVIERIGPAQTVSAQVWDRLRTAEPASSAVTFRLSGRPSDLAGLWKQVSDLAQQHGGEAHASLERGIARCWLPGDQAASPPASLQHLEPGVTRLFERLPAEWWPHLAPSPGMDRIGRSLRDAFDPLRILNRGLLGAEGT